MRFWSKKIDTPEEEFERMEYAAEEPKYDEMPSGLEPSASLEACPERIVDLARRFSMTVLTLKKRDLECLGWEIPLLCRDSNAYGKYHSNALILKTANGQCGYYATKVMEEMTPGAGWSPYTQLLVFRSRKTGELMFSTEQDIDAGAEFIMKQATYAKVTLLPFAGIVIMFFFMPFLSLLLM